MKFEKVTCTTMKPSVIATGVKGGGYIHLFTREVSAMIGTKEFLEEFNESPQQFYERTNAGKKAVTYDSLSVFFRDKSFWLNEGEEIYGAAIYNGFNHTETPVVYTVIYLDTPVTPQSQASPINLTGTIQLNQQ